MTDIIATLQGISANSFKSDVERRKAVTEAHALISRVESPADTILRMALTYPAQIAAVKVMMDLELFQRWIDQNDGGKLTEHELAKLVPCDHVLFMRLLRHLAATNMLRVDEDGSFEMTPFVISIVEDDYASVITYLYQMGMSPALNMPAFFKHNKYQNPTGGEDDCFTHYMHIPVWQYLSSNPAVAENFGRFMKASSGFRGELSDKYPTDDLVCEKEQVLIVDIGGSIGHDLQQFRERHPNAAGRLVLQDQPDVVENAKKDPMLSESIEKQAYDFFTPQPIIGAKIYHLRAVLHDWPDTEAKRILDNIRPALKSGYSKLLIHEVVVSTKIPNVEETTRDMVMISVGSGVERTEEHWKKLIGSAGLEITKIWRSPLYAEAVIEVEPA